LAIAELAPSMEAASTAVVFIGITGSCGKTTAKEFVAAVLATRSKVLRNSESFNVPPHMIDRYLGPAVDDYCLLELAQTKNGKPVFDRVRALCDRRSALLSLARITSRRFDQSKQSQPKREAIAALPARGTAI
jgi:hypothetical protein